MNLRNKFVLAQLLLGLTLAVNVGATVWGLRFLDRELAWPLRSVQSVMSGLHEIKRSGEAQADIVRAPAAVGVDPRTAFFTEQQAVHAMLDRLDALPSVSVRSGVSTARNLRSRTDRIGEMAERWFAGRSPGERDALLGALDERHELIERVEGRILDDASLAVDHGRRLELLMAIVVSVSVVGAAAIAVLISLLVRRWILVPIEHLRVGAEQLAKGDFEHRIGLATDDELGRLGREFDQMAGTIQRMQDERIERERLAAIGEMSRRIVHNLRTPLAGIRGLAEITKSELQPGSDLLEVQDRIIASVDRFEGWLQSLLRSSTPISLHTRAFDPAKLVRAVIESHTDAARARSVGLRFEPDNLPGTVCADPHHLEHALTALVSNAIEFSPPGSDIRLVGGSDGGYWTLEVIDSGPGIPEHLHASVFRPYFTTRPSGTGIGLAIVKQVSEQHGGSVAIRSPADHAQESSNAVGTAFKVRLPVDAGAG